MPIKCCLPVFMGSSSVCHMEPLCCAIKRAFSCQGAAKQTLGCAEPQRALLEPTHSTCVPLSGPPGRGGRRGDKRDSMEAM